MSNFLDQVGRPDGFVFNAVKKQQSNDNDPGPVLSPNGTPLKEDQCICGTINCKESYSCWTSGF